MSALLGLIAEDEPLLAQSLVKELGALWPQLQTGLAANGVQALEMALRDLPQVLFLDIRMPGLSGLEVAQQLTEQWPAGQALPAIVFVTAFDEYAVKAFELAAMDYIVKPVRSARLKQCVERIKQALIAIPGENIEEFAIKKRVHDEQLLQGLRQLLAPTSAARGEKPALLQRISASRGTQTVMIPIHEIIYFEAADKYVRVITADHEYLIRTPIKDLLPQLDAQQFWQIHRGTVVRIDAVLSAQRDEAGKLSLSLHERSEKLSVSRLYQGLFAAM